VPRVPTTPATRTHTYPQAPAQRALALPGDQISGTVEFAYLSSDGSQLETANGPIDGRISGSSVTISDKNDVIMSSGNVSGTFEGSNLVLAFPQHSGQLAPVQFSPASVADYNKAVTTLQNEANQTAAAQQAAAAAARLRLEQVIAATSDALANACVAAGGNVVPESAGSAFPSSCAVDGVSDQVYGGATEVVSFFVEFEAAVPRLTPAFW
jgi:hypothetical protein